MHFFVELSFATCGIQRKRGQLRMRYNGAMHIKDYLIPLAIFLGFEVLACALWLATGTIFYLFNFSYIGSCLALGTILFAKKVSWARQFTLFAIGLYMLGYIGIIKGENMQITGFWYYLFLGVFEGAVIHYLVAKVFGPFLFGRGWCGYACWTAMVLDCLPHKVPASHERKRFGWVRYVVFVVSLLFVGALMLLQMPDLDNVMFWTFIVGNVLYYAVGITLAFVLKDNRAFCKYVCPITVFLKVGTSCARLRIQVDEGACIHCGKCTAICPMDVEVPSNSRKKKNATECILCMECVKECPTKALHL